MRTGLSSMVTLRSTSRYRTAWVRTSRIDTASSTTMGSSDQLGSSSSAPVRSEMRWGGIASSAIRIAPAPAANSPIRLSRSGQMWAIRPAALIASLASGASLPRGASTRIRSSRPCSRGAVTVASEEGLVGARELGHARQDAAECGERFADFQAIAADLELANRAFVRARTLLEHGNRLVHRAAGFEVAQQDHRIREVADVERRRHRVADESMLGDSDQGEDVLVIQVRQQLVQLQQHGFVVLHRVHVAVEAVDQDQLHVFVLDLAADICRQLAGRELAGIELTNDRVARLDELFHVETEPLAAMQKRAPPLVEEIERGPCAGLAEHRRVLGGQDRLADASRADDQRAGAGREATAEQSVEPLDAAEEGRQRRRALV